ncbi:alpha/beta hydrolase [Acuticoccus sediminis]|uniref:Alpha/beta hydrolase n=1 Tax=Acuticoccus sediminis TaxID=2184697 RepID=A0A8B2NDC6_9HYPH|nr:alpha/beta hydrolase [Acuticoccus sediminis]RAH96380.1 alpha/beta hydrolase [Acuticoccus sediminis]
MSKILTLIAAAAAITAATLSAFAQAQPSSAPRPAAVLAAQPIRNIVLVHGAFADGSGWRGVYDELVKRGYRVSIVQNPLTSLADDVAATRRVLARQDGPAVLVGHSYGGSVITEAGDDPKVVGLVYVTAFAPDVGESAGDQFRVVPPLPNLVVDPQPDGFGFFNAENFQAGFAGGASDADASFLRDSQVPVALAALDAKVSVAAWRTKPSAFVVATEDGSIDPRLQRHMANRIGAATTDVQGSHLVFFTQPRAVADVIDRAARTMGSAQR